MTEAERITKYWTDVLNEDQIDILKRSCIKVKSGNNIHWMWVTTFTFADGSVLNLFSDNVWEVS